MYQFHFHHEVEILHFCARILLVANCVPLNVRLADVVVVLVPLLNRTLLAAPTTFVAVVAVVELPLNITSTSGG